MWTAVLLLLLHTVFTFQTTELCPLGWEYVHQTHSCYLRPTRPLPWDEAKSYCEQYGIHSHLATILSLEEKEAVNWMVDEFLTWIGLSLEPEGVWVDGSPINFTQFLYGNSDLLEGPCVAWQINTEQNGWRPIACNYSQFFMCKKPAEGEQPSLQQGTNGRFYSPGFPSGYSNNLYWHHIVETEPGTRVELTFTHLDVEFWRDFVEIMDLAEHPPVSLARLTGQIYDRAIISRSNRVAIIFRTDEDVTAPGFHAHWRARLPDPPTKIHEQKLEEIRSSPYPGPIDRFSLQRHLISCPPENHLIITLYECVLAPNDWLRFSENDEGGLQLASFNTIEKEVEFKTTKPTLFIRYEGVDGEKWSQRWRLEYYCQRDDGLGDEIIIP